MSNQNAYNKAWMDKQKSLGLCIFCKNTKLDNSNLCERHFFIGVASSTLKNRELANQIQELFYAQDRKCYLTGIDLTLGVNASLDHVIPVSKDKSLIGDINNLRWCDKEVNMLKKSIEYDKLILICRNIINNIDNK